MKKIIFIFLFSFLYATCNKSSINAAYKDYYKYQQKYVAAILDNNRQKEIKALEGLIECGEFLKFNVSDYKKKLNSLKKHKPESKIYTKKTTNKSTPSNKTANFSKYIKIYSYNPLKIKIPNSNIKFFSINTKIYKKVIDFPDAILSKPKSKKIGNVNLKIAQFNKKTVRIVYYSKDRFFLKYTIKNNILTIKISQPKNNKQRYQNILAKKNRIYKPKNKIIVIDPGHGGKDSGGIGIKNRYEKTAVLQITKYLKTYLLKKGYIVYLTRNSDYFIPLKKRTHFANLKKADLFISIHCNIAPKHKKSIYGIETYFLSPTRNERAIRVARLENKEIKGLNYLDQRVILNFLNRDRIIESNKLAIDIQKGMLSSLKTRYRNVKDNGVRPAPFWVLVGTQMPAILIEAGYLTNPLESARLFTPAYQKQLAKGIAQGIENYFRKNP